MKVHRCVRSIISIDRRYIHILLCILQKNVNIQFFVHLPLASNTALIRLGMFSMRFWHSSVGMLTAHRAVLETSQKERAISVVRCKNGGMMFQPLHWHCIECVIRHEQDIREEQH